MSVPSEDVAPLVELLVEKYEAIVRLRRHQEPTPIAAMRALAQRFPGSLRELDELPMDVIEGKLVELAGLPPHAPLPRWAAAQLRFHALVRGALLAKRHVRDADPADTCAAEHFQRWTDDPEAHAWAGELATIRRPPRGRLLDLVFARLGRELGIDESEARRLVFSASGRGAAGRARRPT